EMCGQAPGGRFEPEPPFAAIGDPPSAHLLGGGPRRQPQTEDTAPDELAARTRDILDRGPRPLLRRGIGGPVGRDGEEVDVIGTIHAAEGADRFRDAALLDHLRDHCAPLLSPAAAFCRSPCPWSREQGPPGADDGGSGSSNYRVVTSIFEV